MNDTVCVMLFTYNRLAYAKRTLDALARNLKTSRRVLCHIADDGDGQDYLDDIYAFAAERFSYVSLTNSYRRGYGASYNAATHVAHDLSGILLPLEDDWELQRPLDIDPMVDALGDGDVGCIRMGYIGYTQPLRGEFIYRGGYHYLLLDPDSPEPHVFAGGPRLETREFQRNVGLWPEGLHAGETEFVVAHRREARIGVAWPVDLIRPSGDAFAHIGTESVKDAPLEVTQ